MLASVHTRECELTVRKGSPGSPSKHFLLSTFSVLKELPDPAFSLLVKWQRFLHIWHLFLQPYKFRTKIYWSLRQPLEWSKGIFKYLSLFSVPTPTPCPRTLVQACIAIAFLNSHPSHTILGSYFSSVNHFTGHLEQSGDMLIQDQ